jgi:hypothetical protein
MVLLIYLNMRLGGLTYVRIPSQASKAEPERLGADQGSGAMGYIGIRFGNAQTSD